jgi:hypothetical protein
MEIDSKHAPEGTVAAPCTCGCAGCVFDKPGRTYAGCVKRQPSCSMFDRPDERSVIFVPATSPGSEAAERWLFEQFGGVFRVHDGDRFFVASCAEDGEWLASALNELDVLERVDG